MHHKGRVQRVTDSATVGTIEIFDIDCDGSDDGVTRKSFPTGTARERRQLIHALFVRLTDGQCWQSETERVATRKPDFILRRIR